MDEPTAALGVHETEMVADLIKELKAQGLGIFLISHDTREMMDLCDRVAVMKNGKLIGNERVEDVTDDDSLSMIIMGKNPKKAA
jgi:D-xylose transport system ATP-binding protein